MYKPIEHCRHCLPFAPEEIIAGRERIDPVGEFRLAGHG
jgi:hypothetical protein